MNKKYFAEGLGTFTLALVVYLAASNVPGLPLPIPVLAALALGLCVYTIGPISGCHINPAVTLGAFSIKKISANEAVGYIVAQFVGAGLALGVGSWVFNMNPGISPGPFTWTAFLAEALGAFFFTFGIASVIYGKTPSVASGVVIGGSLFLGVLVASLAGSAGILNPAVAFTLHSFNWTYALAPIVGSVIGMKKYRYLAV